MASPIQGMVMPFHNITMKVKRTVSNARVGTNDGPIDKTHVQHKDAQGKFIMEPDNIRVLNEATYSPVGMSAEAGFVELVKDGTKPVLGVLMESFVNPDQPHKIMVEGIVPMQAQAKIKAGQLVTGAAPKTGAGENTVRTRVKPAGTGTPQDYVFGIALDAAENEGDWLPILIGTVGGKGKNV